VDYDVIVVGLGHAGCEAALACARLGCSTIGLTVSMDNIAQMSCNPSLGGPAKAHLIREIDALGGEMGIVADETFIQVRMLNTSKGPAVRAIRAQIDKAAYQARMKRTLQCQPGLVMKEAEVRDLIVRNGKVTGVVTDMGEILSQAVILATGTHLGGRVHMGEMSYESGPDKQPAAVELGRSLRRHGLVMNRFKTGTPARIDGRTVDYSATQVQLGEDLPYGFSYMGRPAPREQIPCWQTWTNERTHRVILENLDRAPMYSGAITGTGPRYCPAIETKIVRFPDRPRHQVYVEPQGRQDQEMYLSGVSTSFPVDVQEKMIRTIRGLEDVHIMKYGYAIEYDCIDPTQLAPTLESLEIEGLYFAGQINGTSGYEEAAAQGLLAGINAAMRIVRRDEQPLILDRSEAYIGVLIDDLVSKGGLNNRGYYYDGPGEIACSLRKKPQNALHHAGDAHWRIPLSHLGLASHHTCRPQAAALFHRVIAACTERMASCQPSYSQPRASNDTILCNCFFSVLRTCWNIATRWILLERGYECSVKPDQPQLDPDSPHLISLRPYPSDPLQFALQSESVSRDSL
jgi:tRNA uridine 5-carboxymethylaminomethyl modification enzyme